MKREDIDEMYALEDRPVEPCASNEDPELWCEIAQWESDRADAYRDALTECEQNMADHIQHTRTKSGMKVSIPGLLGSIVKARGIDEGRKYAICELVEHYTEARNAWLSGDLHTVSEFFGLYTTPENETNNDA